MPHLPPPRQRPGYSPTRIGQKFGDLKIIGDGDRSGWYLAQCGLCGKEVAVSERRLEQGLDRCDACLKYQQLKNWGQYHGLPALPN